jgi:predicted ArsR family transcriptional regulator
MKKEADEQASMREVGRALAKEHMHELTKKSRKDRLTFALDLLKKLGGAAVFHQDDGKFIRSNNCPIAAITAHCPDACLIVEALLKEISGVPVKNSVRAVSRRRVALKLAEAPCTSEWARRREILSPRWPLTETLSK